MFSFALCTGASHMAFRRARQDPENAYFFSRVAPASWRDYSITAIIAAVLAFFGPLLMITDGNHWVALAGLTLTLMALSYQLRLTHRYWMHTLLKKAPTETSD